MVKIGVIDSGLNFRVIPEDNIIRKNLTGESSKDKSGHGTWVTTKIYNINPNVDLYIYKVLQEKGGTIDDLLRGFRKAELDNLDIINFSMGTIKNYSRLEAMCTMLSRKVLLICASGNNYDKSKYYPAFYESTLSVGSVSGNYNKSTFSNSADIYTFGEKQSCITLAQESLVRTGTSMACAIVTGYLSYVAEDLKEQGFSINKENVLNYLFDNNGLVQKNNLYILNKEEINK